MQLPASTLVLDAEIAVFDDQLVWHLGYLGRHAKKFAPARRTTAPVLMAFDCLVVRGRDLRGKLLHARRAVLEREFTYANEYGSV
jgi:ATP-dependent DNA ligase